MVLISLISRKVAQKYYTGISIIYFLIPRMKENSFYEKLLFKLLIVTVKDKEGTVLNGQDQYKLFPSITC